MKDIVLWESTIDSSVTASLTFHDRDALDLDLDWPGGATGMSIRLARDEAFALRDALDLGLQMGT